MFSGDERSNQLRPQILTAFAGQLMNDSERARLFGLPETCRIREHAKIISPDRLTLGEHCWIGEGAMLDASGGLTVGEHTTIAVGAQIYTHSSWLANVTLQNFPDSDLIERRPVRIGNGCFIGPGSVVLAGVTIGDFAVVRPLSLVDEDVAEHCVVAGNPARTIRVNDPARVQARAERVRARTRLSREAAERDGQASASAP
ncbi:acyltransferase [Streptomycetaceae bacterium NBC_01309]